MSDVLTLTEIQERFHSEWVLVEDPVTTEVLEVQGGKVLFHSKNREEVYRRAMQLAPRHCAILFTGTLPAGTVVVL